MIRIAIDTGGTFTDFAMFGTSEKGTLRQSFIKYPTDHENPANSIIAGLKLLAQRENIDLHSLLAETKQIIHGTTLTLNALLEMKGAKTALFTTEGFRDALEIRRSQLKNQWDLSAQMPPTLVPRYLRIGIPQRMDYKGDVIRELDEEAIVKACEKCQQNGVRSIAVCYLFSFLNPQHEQRTAEIIRRELPDTFVSISSDIAPKIREYERTTTTVINAYLAPVLGDYLRQLKARLADYGWEKPVHIMMNNGGLSDITAMEHFPVRTLLSGPGGGACGNHAVAQLRHTKETILADMGGTSFDIHVTNPTGHELTPIAELAGYPLSIPMLDIHSIGAGGGSIVTVDSGKRLLVGPASAGSMPGPACYNRGGTDVTITDALLLLGLMDENRFSGGQIKLNRQAAETQISEKIAKPLNITTLTTASYMIYRIASEKMADALRLTTVAKGHDIRRYSLIAAGGAFPLFAANIMNSLHMKEVLIPMVSPVFCAWGMMSAARRYDFSRSFFMEQEHFDSKSISDRLEEMHTIGKKELCRLGVPEEEQSYEITAEMRYIGQHHEISVPWQKSFTEDSAVLSHAFHQKHLQVYEYAEPEQPWEIIHFHLTAKEKEPQSPLFSFPSKKASSAIHTVTLCGEPFGEKGNIKVTVFHEENFSHEIFGPALIHLDFTTILVPSGVSAKKTQDGLCVLKKREV